MNKPLISYVIAKGMQKRAQVEGPVYNRDFSTVRGWMPSMSRLAGSWANVMPSWMSSDRAKAAGGVLKRQDEVQKRLNDSSSFRKVPGGGQQYELKPSGSDPNGWEKAVPKETQAVRTTGTSASLSAAGVRSRDLKDYQGYVKQMQDQGWDEAKIKEQMGAQFKEKGFFGSQEEADRMQRAGQFLYQNPEYGKMVGMDASKSTALAASTGGTENLSQTVKNERIAGVNDKLGFGGEAVVGFADWANKNKKWLIPAGLGVAGLGAFGLMGGFGGRDEQQQPQGMQQPNQPPKWRVGDQWGA
jgi:hypothetical protein